MPDQNRRKFKIQVAQMIREYANVEIEAENEQEALAKARDIDWGDLLDADLVRLDYDHYEDLDPIVID